jgi:hypothetical protein
MQTRRATNPAPKKAKKPPRSAKELGPTGKRVAENVKRLRGRVTVRELSERVARYGGKILPSGITKIEQGERHVDVDDLVALALALDATPNRLLLPAEADDTNIQTTSTISGPAVNTWRWANGQEPLLQWQHTRELFDFRRNNRPLDPYPEERGQWLFTFLKARAEPRDPATAPIRKALTKIDKALADASEADIPLEAIVEYLQFMIGMGYKP